MAGPVAPPPLVAGQHQLQIPFPPLAISSGARASAPKEMPQAKSRSDRNAGKKKPEDSDGGPAPVLPSSNPLLLL